MTGKMIKTIIWQERRISHMKLTAEKYHGLGNDYLVYDPNKNKL